MIATPNVSVFRYDINGLRAIAVMAVMLFHFRIPGFSGGYIGVDVFFVLSGFLMTSIILKGLERGGVADKRGIVIFLWRFYLARAQRIVPALLVLVLILLVIGWWTLPQGDYRALGIHGFSALSFLSNVVFWHEAGYFDAASHEKWLLHTWSLSVEWQFYILLPLVLLVVWRIIPSRTGLLLAMGLGVVASLAASVWLTEYSPSFAFFMLPTRAWQMLAGGFIYLIANKISLRRSQASALQVMGLICIGVSILLFDDSSKWPGINALLPVLGTLLVLLSAKQSGWTRYRLVQWLGLSSYSVYLWHWPVFVGLVYLDLTEGVIAVGIGMLLSLLMGAVSYHLIENTSRRWGRRQNMAKPAMIIAASTLLVSMPGLAIYQQNGVAGRMPSAVESVAAETFNVNPRREECHHVHGRDFPWCTFGGSDIRAILVGDSHAASVVTALETVLGRDSNDYRTSGVLYNSYSACPTLFGIRADRSGWYCAAFNEAIAEKVAKISSSVPLIIVNSGGYSANPLKPSIYFDKQYRSTTPAFLKEYSEALIDSACRLAENRRVYLLRPIPKMEEDAPRVMARSVLLGNEREVRITREDYDKRYMTVWKAQDAAAASCNVGLLDVTEYLCDEDYCYGSEEGMPLYYDEGHLSEYGNRKLIPMFEQWLQEYAE